MHDSAHTLELYTMCVLQEEIKELHRREAALQVLHFRWLPSRLAPQLPTHNAR
jgi:hypothetical protein